MSTLKYLSKTYHYTSNLLLQIIPKTIFFAVIFLITPCISLKAEQGATEKHLGEIRVGAALPLTGGSSHVGTDIQKGMKLALEEQNYQDREKNNSSPNIKMFFEDDQQNPITSLSAAKKLIEINKVNILISLWDMCNVIAPFAEQKKIPHLCISWDPHITEKFKYTATFESTYKSYAKSQIELLKRLKTNSVAVITEEAQGWRLTSDEFKKLLSETKIKLVTDSSYTPPNFDFGSLVTKVLAQKPDVVIVYAHQPYLDVILKRLREQNPQQQVTGYFEDVDPQSLVEGMPFVAQFQVEPWFQKKFLKRFGEEYKVRAPHGYDLVKMLIKIYEDSPLALNGSDFITRINEIENFPGASGSLSSNKTRNIENVCVWRIVTDGVLKEFK